MVLKPLLIFHPIIAIENDVLGGVFWSGVIYAEALRGPLHPKQILSVTAMTREHLSEVNVCGNST